MFAHHKGVNDVLYVIIYLLMRRNLFLILLLIGPLCLISQDGSVTGVILDGESSNMLPFVSVFNASSGDGAISDLDGVFNVGASIGDTIEFSFVGYTSQNLVVSDFDILTINLALSSTSLDEVVVIGYSTQKKKEVTGAVSVVSADQIAKLNPVRVEQALQGQVSGVNVTTTSGAPGAASTISIRGIATNGDNRPLILVDGNVIEDLSVLNPGDIKSINVLKDATAGIYGVRAANGVILITTKTGRINTPLRIEFDAYTGVQETSRKLPLLNATEYGVIVNESLANGGSTPMFTNFTTLGEGTRWQDDVFEKAPINNLGLNLSGGSKIIAYSIGTNYLTQDGTIGRDKSNFNRFNGRLNLDVNITDKLKLSTASIYTNSNRSTLLENTLGSVLFNALNMSPTLPIRDAAGEFTLAEGLGNEVINPFAQIANTYNRTTVNKLSSSMGLSYALNDQFKVESRIQLNTSNVKSNSFAPDAYYGSGKVFNVERNSYTEGDNSFDDYTWDNFITYTNSFNDHNINALLGSSVYKTTGEFRSFTGFELPSNNYDDASLESASDVVDNFRNGGNTFDSRLLSYFTRLQYNFKGKYLISAVLRRDGSTKFGPENKFGFFPSGSIGYVAVDNNIGGGNGFLDFLKFRLSYGIIGNDRIADFRYVSLLNGEGAYVFNNELVFGLASGALANPEIKWEKQRTLNVGLDAKMFNGSVIGSIDYFRKKTEDLLVQATVAGVLGAAAPGASSPIINAGIVENSGVEFQVGYQNYGNDDFSWGVNYNLTYLKNEVLFVNSDNGFIPGGSFGIGQEPPSRMEVGFPIGYFFGLQSDGIFQTTDEVEAHVSQQNAAPGELRYKDINQDGQIDANDRTSIGDPIPDYTMGLNFNVEWKKIDFSTSAFASLGNDIVRNFDRNQALTNKTTYVLDRWRGTNTTTETPRVTSGATSNLLFSDYYVEDGSYVRIQNIQIGYSIENLLQKETSNELRLYVSVNNPFTFTKYSGYDPAASSGAPIGGGIDQGFYPVSRLYLFGVNFKF
ncbi:MAG: TonB-linked SusC/RagA family outer membrane protein [Saprospiraceae bacterium]|jgi:TonB-linked SusC/RagA family outer membrane protein